ncbi:hypothetical protein OTU49_007185, partial [Cherax quadricarinatus]
MIRARRRVTPPLQRKWLRKATRHLPSIEAAAGKIDGGEEGVFVSFCHLLWTLVSIVSLRVLPQCLFSSFNLSYGNECQHLSTYDKSLVNQANVSNWTKITKSKEESITNRKVLMINKKETENKEALLKNDEILVVNKRASTINKKESNIKNKASAFNKRASAINKRATTAMSHWCCQTSPCDLPFIFFELKASWTDCEQLHQCFNIYNKFVLL